MQTSLRSRKFPTIDAAFACAADARALLVERLAARFRDHHIITEAGGGREQASRWVWLVDPLNGTNNYAPMRWRV